MTIQELNVASERLEPRSSGWHRAARQARLLSWFSLAWMGAEGAIAVTAGVLAGSIALIGFGIDSAIEGLASLVIVWRFTGTRLRSETAEHRAQKLVAVQFFLRRRRGDPQADLGRASGDELAGRCAHRLEPHRHARARCHQAAPGCATGLDRDQGVKACRTSSAPISPAQS